MSHLRKAITTWGKTWSARAVELKTRAIAMGFKVILIMTWTMPSTTTSWYRNLRPSTLRHCTSRPSAGPLNRQHMYAMGWVVHVLVVQLVFSPLISLPPKAKLSKVTIPMAIFIVKPALKVMEVAKRWWSSAPTWKRRKRKTKPYGDQGKGIA